jgi:hypothetical protein
MNSNTGISPPPDSDPGEFEIPAMQHPESPAIVGDLWINFRRENADFRQLY